MGLRPVSIAVLAATAASFATGWWADVEAKTNPTTPVAVATSSGTRQFATASAVSAAAPDDPTFQQKILPFLKTYCLDCHNADKAAGGVTLEGYQSEAHARKNRKDWAAVQHVLAAGEMPPKKKPQPPKAEREFVISWIDTALTRVDCTGPKDPGRVTIRRLNRAEYNNTIRDLCGVDFRPADDFPADDVGYGFDNIGDVLSFQPILLEKYMTAADKILTKALTVPELTPMSKQPFPAQNLNVFPSKAKIREGERVRIVFGEAEGWAYPAANFEFPETGDYTLRFQGWGKKAGGEFPKVVIRVGERDLKTFTVDQPEGKRQTYEVKVRLKAGEKGFRVAFINPFRDEKTNEVRQFGLRAMEVEGPDKPEPRPEPASIKLLLGTRPTDKADHRAAAEKVLSAFARRAFRRPLRTGELTRLMKLYDVATGQGEPFEKAVRLPMKAVLVSPHFLYRIEDDPTDPNGVRTLNDFEFATRMSYFLWSTMPDDELAQLAEQGTLRDPGVLGAQVRRMLKDPRARALGENFAGQWLQLRNVRNLDPDKGYFSSWDESLRAGMVGEAEAFFAHVVQDDRSILDFLDADYTFVNARMAKHYDIPGVSGAEFRKVRLPDTRRGGIITMASTLAVTSNPTRTSPVKRGKWILENVLGTPPPPPAPDVPELPPTGQLKGTLRQQMEQHRANPSCATCHAKLDPLGFGLENFDAIGGWRTTDNKKPIDSSGVLPDGAKFGGPAELRKVLLGKADQFRRCFAEKMLTFALGRGLEYYDKCAVDEIVAAAKADNDRFSAVVMAVVRSDPFQKRKGKRSE